MCGIGAPENGFGASQFVAVGHSHEVVAADHGLEHGLPPGQFQLTPDLVGGHATVLHVLQELPQPARTQVVQEHGAFGQRGQVGLVVDQIVESGFQLLDVR